MCVNGVHTLISKFEGRSPEWLCGLSGARLLLLKMSKRRKTSDVPLRLPGFTGSAVASSATAPPATVQPISEGAFTSAVQQTHSWQVVESAIPVTPASVQSREHLPLISASSSHDSRSCIPTRAVVPAVTSRADTPVVQAYTRGNKKLLFDLASNASARQRCASELEDLAYTSKAQETRESRLRLWDDLATRAQLETTQFNVTLVYTLMGLLKKAGYRSAAQYLHVARQRHVSDGGIVSPRTSMACARAERAARRGRGPGKQAQPLPLARFSELPAQSEELVPGGYTNPRRAMVSAAWRLLRETELSHRRARDVRWYAVADSFEVESHLSVTKTDPTALGCFRTHRCTCNRTDDDSMDCCPCCCDIRQVEWLRAQHPDVNDEDFGDLVLYPTADGCIVSKKAAVATFEAAASILVLALRAHNGARKYTGHCMRVTGAVFLAASGVDVWRIMALGRWGSDAIKLYLRDAHATTTGSITLEAQLGRSLETSRNELSALQTKAREVRASLGKMVHTGEAIVSREGHAAIPVTDSDLLDGELARHDVEDDKETTGELELVLNKSPNGKLHSIKIGDINTDPWFWSSHCGWKFGRECALAQRTDDWIAAQLCPTCFSLKPASKRSSTSAKADEKSGSSISMPSSDS